MLMWLVMMLILSVVGMMLVGNQNTANRVDGGVFA